MGIITNLITICVAIFAIAWVMFANYPPPPHSPILYQWKESGRKFSFSNYELFYVDERVVNSAVKDKVLLCLHGFPTSSFDYFKMKPLLKNHFSRLVFLDFLGLGFSDKPRYHFYSIEEQSDIVEGLLKSLHLQDVHILSHDYGDTVVQELLARQSEEKLTFTINSVAMMNGGIFPSLYQPLFIQKLLRVPIVGTILGKLSNYYLFRISLERVFGASTVPTIAEYHDLWAITRHKDGYRVHSELLSYMDQREANQERWVNALKNTKTPLHFIYGPSDPINGAPFQEHFRETVKSASIDVLPSHIGHYPHFEDPQLTISSYEKFLVSLVNQEIK